MVYSAFATGTTGVMNGLETAFWAWLGISLTTTIIGGAMETRDAKVMYIAAGNRLITLLAMGAVLGLFMR